MIKFVAMHVYVVKSSNDTLYIVTELLLMVALSGMVPLRNQENVAGGLAQTSHVRTTTESIEPY